MGREGGREARREKVKLSLEILIKYPAALPRHAHSDHFTRTLGDEGRKGISGFSFVFYYEALTGMASRQMGPNTRDDQDR